ncbi:hypothetical protein JK2ML_0152 [Mycobacterium leprae Kyoto-2]|uniref:Uncharacterized protein n=3 Tax=Mycobacterium leprae TaxID=1769 RepID=Q9CD73_MYCLE|nr:hypothetical protein DIJ64_00785 [Mycobacterium leprae]OAR20643.1 hypothetical protein A8144_09895 [Mycobacterium leprae 3125609]OAX70856.1 hypothetical protein A3216_09375 [Mycobacterium leprae 7935681]CAR70245.1 hypothetical protein MLBr00152 [Mycobacterium leprae Br4923]BBC16400.1 hypothetical protein JK2ML_0152 [Mycobacterium leprae Kyoto-2]
MRLHKFNLDNNIGIVRKHMTGVQQQHMAQANRSTDQGNNAMAGCLADCPGAFSERSASFTLG